MKMQSMKTNATLEHIRQAFWQAEYAINVTDLSGTIIAVNNAYLELYGFQQEEDVIGQTQRLIRSPKNSKTLYQDMWETIAQDKVWKGELLNQTIHGEEIPVYLSICPLFENNEKVAYMGFTIDRSQQVELEQQLLHSNRLAVLGVLGAGLAHELNNPLTSISLEAENLRDQMEEGIFHRDGQLNSVETILKGVDRMQRVISHLLVYVRKGSESGEEEICMSDLITDSRLFLERQFSNRNIYISTNIDENQWVRGKRTDLESVFHNLLTNSRDAFEENEGRLESRHNIEITSSVPEEGWVEFIYRDNAGGIPSSVIPKIFDPFFTTKKEGKGTGLGLSISNKIIKEHKGSLRVNVYGNSTEFKILLPTVEKVGRKNSWLDDL